MNFCFLMIRLKAEQWLRLLRDSTLSMQTRELKSISTKSLTAICRHRFRTGLWQVIFLHLSALATSFGTMVGTLGTVLFYGTATINLVWQHIGWKAVENRQYHKLYLVDMGLPWLSHLVCSFIPTVIMCKLGANVVEMIKTVLPMDGIAMMTLFTVGSLLPCVGIAILLKQIVKKATDFVPFLFGFVLAASMGINLVSATVVAGMFAIINYKIKMLAVTGTAASDADDDEEDI